jgi:hypothetical protein
MSNKTVFLGFSSAAEAKYEDNCVMYTLALKHFNHSEGGTALSEEQTVRLCGDLWIQTLKCLFRC